jgi:hypothetical protein
MKSKVNNEISEAILWISEAILWISVARRPRQSGAAVWTSGKWGMPVEVIFEALEK